MPSLIEPVVVACLCDLLLGIIVLCTNWRRPVNVSFFLVALSLACWLASRHMALLSTTDPWWAMFWIRTCSVCGACIPPAGAALQASILYRPSNWRGLAVRIRGWLAATAFTVSICLTPFYLKGVELPAPAVARSVANIPTASYGWGLYVLMTHLVVGVLWHLYAVTTDLRRHRADGVRAVELQYMQLGYVVLLASMFISSHYDPRRLGPFGTLAFVTVIAYGITTRSILDVRTFMRRILSNCVLFAYACTVFWVTWEASRWAFTWGHAGEEAMHFWPPLLGAFAVALLVTPSHNSFQRLARRISPPRDLDFEKTITRVEEIIQTFTSRRTLLDGFCRALREESHTDRVAVALLHNDKRFKQIYPPPIENTGLLFLPGDPVVSFLRDKPSTEISLEHLERQATGPARDAQLDRLRALKSDAILALRLRGELVGLIIMGQRRGGRIFGRLGLGVLRVLADQLAIALDNCRLYMEAKRTAAYVQTLVENLTVGVVAVDSSEGVTVFNREAERLLTLSREEAHTLRDLPPAAGRLLGMTLAERTFTRDEVVTLRPDTPAQADLLVSSLPFTFEEDDLYLRPVTGAIIVLTDRTALLRLERQVHQSERLASIGTLAAGTAHEIKNPLVSLRVFTQLLPKRFDDPEFRATFHELVGGEIARIENIVNQMLDFARPSKPALAPVNLHVIIGNVLRLVDPQATKNGIELRRNFAAADDALTADRAKLQQVLLNLLINALESFDAENPVSGRRVEISTRLDRGFPGDPNDPDCPTVLVTDVRDNGPGIPAEMLPHLFDPFFTTKGNGTGLGLSVSHTIVRDHGGFLEVYSEPGRGTRFSMRLPVTPPPDSVLENDESLSQSARLFAGERLLKPGPVRPLAAHR